MNAKLTKIAIALGGNLGDAAANFRFALNCLSAGGVKNINISRLFHSKPENCPPGSPDFSNAALTGEWADTPGQLLQLCREAEIAAGRPREHGFNAPRTLDLDIILFGNQIINLPGLQIPHPRAVSRLFVLQPLAEIAPDWIFPDSGKSVQEALNSLNSM